MGHWTVPSRRAELADALKAVARKPLNKVFQEDDGSDQADFKILTEVAKELRPDDWKTRGYNMALREVILQATKAMSRDTGPREHSRMSWGEIAATLYGFEHGDEADKVVAKNNHAYSRRYQVVKRRSFVEDSTVSEKVITPLWPLLADALVSLSVRGQERPVSLVAANPLSGNASRRNYIRREALETQFRRALEAGERVIVFVGQAGMGKTRLATELTRTVQGAEPLTIRFDRGKPHQADIQAALLAVSSPPAVNVPAQIASICSADNAPPVILIDNLDTADELVSMIPANGKSVIVATSLAIGKVDTDKYCFIKVGPMTDEEAVRLVCARAPTLSAQEARHLALWLYAYPLLIIRALAVIELGGMTVTEFCDQVAEQPGEYVGYVRADGMQTLGAVVTRLLELLRQDDLLAFQILRMVCYYNRHSYGQILKETLWFFALANLRDAPSRIRFEQSLVTLNRYSLVTPIEHMTPTHSSGLASVTFLHVDALTFHLIYEILPAGEVPFGVGLVRTEQWIMSNYRLSSEFTHTSATKDEKRAYLALGPVLLLIQSTFGRVIVNQEPTSALEDLKTAKYGVDMDWWQGRFVEKLRSIGSGDLALSGTSSSELDQYVLELVPGLDEWLNQNHAILNITNWPKPPATD